MTKKEDNKKEWDDRLKRMLKRVKELDTANERRRKRNKKKEENGETKT